MPDESVKKKSSFFQELQRRNVFRVASVYAITAWLVIQIAVAIFPYLNVPNWFTTAVIIFFLFGFPIALVLAWAFELSPEGIIRTTSVEADKNPYPPAKKKPFTGTIVNIALVILLILQHLYFNYWTEWSADTPVSDTAGINDKSIAVLPFENISSNQENEYFSDGLTEDIITQLSKITALKVISRTSVLQYKDNPKSVKQIAGELGVSVVLEGSVRRIGNRIRISGQLIDAINDRHLWAESYDRDMEDVFEIQSEIAKTIASKLEAQLTPSEKESIEKKPTENITAYDYYLKGRDYYYHYTDEYNELAIAQFKEAIALDPDYALAWAGLGDAYSQKNIRFGYDVSWNDSSIVAGEKAITLDPSSSEAYKALANAYNYAQQYDKAFELLQKAVELNPNNAPAVGNLGSSYFLRGELADALMWEKKAAALNPNNSIPFYIIGWIYRLLGDLPSAELWLKKSINMRPLQDAYRELAYTYVSQGKHDEALSLLPSILAQGEENSRVMETAGMIAGFAGNDSLAEIYYRQSIALNPSVMNDPHTVSLLGLGRILMEKGKQMEGNILLARATALALNEFSNGAQADEHPYHLAAIYAVQGKKEEALKWLQQAVAYNWIDYALLEHSPYFKNINDEPEFQTIVSQLKAKMEAMRRETEQEDALIPQAL
ncbi:tetratricopeptide repeat protein [Catalinimonas sp. 4WD22]|uniref:TPR end-of-group domain-containing protein n=1 Tax=Catalinimonas locisalis TaxID=3133978 RepID=UPI003101B0C2